MKNIAKKVICFALAACTMLSVSVSAFAVEAKTGEKRAVIGANLTEDQVKQVYDTFGVTRGSVPEMTVTNAEERAYLEGLVDSAVIGTNSISCVYIEILDRGSGLEVGTSNLTWCTQDMIVNALVTAGIDDARIKVTAPFAVSGTAALTGIYKAYEDITGERIPDDAKLISTQEFVITGELADEIGSYDAVTIVNELKLILSETVNMSDEDLRKSIRQIAKDNGVSLTDGQVNQLVVLCRSLEKMDSEQLREQVEYVQNMAKKLSDAQEKVSSIKLAIENVVETVRSIVDSVMNFLHIGQK